MRKKKAKISEELVEDENFDVKIKTTRRNRYENCLEHIYKVIWNDFGPEEDTWKPTRHLSRSKILQFHKERKEKIPLDIDNDKEG